MTTGFIDDLGRWIVDGATAHDLPIGASVCLLENGDGLRITKGWGAQAKTELGWAGAEPLGDTLDSNGIYQVWMDSVDLGVCAPASSYREYEASIGRANGASRHAFEGAP